MKYPEGIEKGLIWYWVSRKFFNGDSDALRNGGFLRKILERNLLEEPDNQSGRHRLSRKGWDLKR